MFRVLSNKELDEAVRLAEGSDEGVSGDAYKIGRAIAKAQMKQDARDMVEWLKRFCDPSQNDISQRDLQALKKLAE